MGEPLFGHRSAIDVEVVGSPFFKPEAAHGLAAELESARPDITARGDIESDAQREEVPGVNRAGIAMLQKRLSAP
jgi:hypothetical protein